MNDCQPNVVVLAGPNGAGKTTSAPTLLDEVFGLKEFVNADVIAKGLSSFRPETAAIRAGRIMLRRLAELSASKADFAFETTLASKSFAPFLRRLISDGYSFHLMFLWLSNVDLAISRVSLRVASGGHDIPEPVIRRRYDSGLRNFFRIYRPLTTSWTIYDNSLGEPSIIAEGTGETTSRVLRLSEWEAVQHYG